VNPSTGLAAGSVTTRTVSTNIVYSSSVTAAASCYIPARGSNGDASGSVSIAAGSPSLMAAGGSTEDGNDPGFRRTSPRKKCNRPDLARPSQIQARPTRWLAGQSRMGPKGYRRFPAVRLEGDRR
jgi:hypothetical protein